MSPEENLYVEIVAYCMVFGTQGAAQSTIMFE